LADVASSLSSWSTTASSNSPSGSTVTGAGLDDNLREIQAVVRAGLAHKGADISSATTTDLGAVAGLMHDITGTTTITGFGTVSAGIWKIIKFEGALTLTHNATSLIIPGAQNITTANGDIAIVISEGSGNWRVVSYIRANGAGVDAAIPRGYIDGLILSNDTDTDHDIEITAGECRDSTNAVNMRLSSAITKQIDAAWSVGDNQGGLDGSESSAGTPDADTWYYVWLIKRSDTGVVDALFSESSTAPTMPTNYDYKRLIGAVRTDGSANIRQFYQDDDWFRWQASISVLSSGAATSNTSVTISSAVPSIAAAFEAYASAVAAHASAGIAMVNSCVVQVATSVDYATLATSTDDTSSGGNNNGGGGGTTIIPNTGTFSYRNAATNTQSRASSIWVTGFKLSR